MNLGGQLICISLVKLLDHIWCINEVFGWFPTCGVRGVVKPSPFNKVEQPRSLAMVIHPAVEYLMDFSFVRVI